MENAEILAACQLPAPFDVNGVQVEIHNLAFVEPNDLIVHLTAVLEGETVYDQSEDFIFRNPPIMVPDGGSRTVEHELVGSVEVSTFETNPDAALVTMVADTLRTVLGLG